MNNIKNGLEEPKVLSPLQIQQIKKNIFLVGNGKVIFPPQGDASPLIFEQKIRFLPSWLIIRYYSRILKLGYHSYIWSKLTIVEDSLDSVNKVFRFELRG